MIEGRGSARRIGLKWYDDYSEGIEITVDPIEPII